MADPLAYSPTYSFSDFETSSPGTPKPGVPLDDQFADIAQSTMSLRDAIKNIRRSDGKLANQSVGPDQLAASLSIGFTLQGTWASGVSYSGGDGVTYGTSFYKARVAHTSSPSTRPDLDPSTWTFLVSVASISVSDNSITPAKLVTGSGAAFHVVLDTANQLGSLIASMSSKTTPDDADSIPLSDSAATGASKRIPMSALNTWLASKLGVAIAALSGKSAPDDGDTLLLSDNAAMGASKKLAWASLTSAIANGLGAKIAALAAKTSLVDADSFLIQDSAAGAASKQVTLATLRASSRLIAEITEYAGLSAPTNWAFCYGQSVSRTTYPAYWAAVHQEATVTVTIASPGVVTWTGHTLKNGDQVRLYTTGTLPTGLAANTSYYVVNAGTNTFQLSATRGGSAINTSGTQSGTQSAVYAPFGFGDGSTTCGIPDLRGRAAIGRDDMGGTSANRLTLAQSQGVDGDILGMSGGEEGHVLTTTEAPNLSPRGVNLSPQTVNIADSFYASNASNAHNNVQPSIVVNKIIYLGA